MIKSNGWILLCDAIQCVCLHLCECVCSYCGLTARRDAIFPFMTSHTHTCTQKLIGRGKQGKANWACFYGNNFSTKCSLKNRSFKHIPYISVLGYFVTLPASQWVWQIRSEILSISQRFSKGFTKGQVLCLIRLRNVH